MKVYNYISMLLLAGIALFASCSQDEEIGGENMDSMQGFQINVFDEGYQSIDANKTRATESDYSTKFAEGDAIGIFAVKGETVVDEINNRKFTMQDGVWTLDDDGDPIEYKGSQYQKMSFYAYYPYNKNVTFEPAKVDPFETYVNNWKVGENQGEGEYTKYDLMTSTGVVEGDRLKGKISFTMKHQMALAVIQMPEIVYSFTNGNIDDYKLPVSVGTFTLNNAEATPYYQESTDTYRFLVNPKKIFSIKGTYDGIEEMEYTAGGTLEGGTAKMYTINDKSKINHTLQVGDYFCADGNIVSKDSETVPDGCIGIVFYVGNPQPSATPADATYTEENDALRRDYPNCTHGLIIAVNNAEIDEVKTAIFSSSRDYYYGNWFANDETWTGKFVGCDAKNTLPLPGMLGYNNTVLMEMSPLKEQACDIVLNYVNAYRTNVPTPISASDWFVPSLQELEEVLKVISAVNSKLKIVSGGEGLNVGGRYWSSNERTGNNTVVYQHTFASSGSYLVDKYRNQAGGAGYFRLMLAF